MTKEKELFQKLYPAKEVYNNPFKAVEAVGYLKHLKIINPEQAIWIDPLILALLLNCAVKMTTLKKEMEKENEKRI